MEQTQSQLNKFSRVIYVFAKIGFITAIVGVCMAAAAMVCLAITGGVDFSLKLFGVTVHGLFADVAGNTANAWASTAYALTYCAFLISVMHMLMRLFANMRDLYTPFTMENAALFKKMAIWMIVASIVPAVVGQSVGQACASMMNLTCTAEFGDSFSVIAVLVLFAMSMVFKYGCALQEQADTTL